MSTRVVATTAPEEQSEQGLVKVRISNAGQGADAQVGEMVYVSDTDVGSAVLVLSRGGQ